MRDRLIKLISNADCDDNLRYYDLYDVTDTEHGGAELFADYLLANGVIVPPCKIGDTVYLIPTYNGKPYCGVVEDKIQMIGITSRGFHIKVRNHHDHNKMYMLGKTVFLAKEEAERALKGGEG